MHFFHRAIASLLFFLHSILLMAMVDSYHKQAKDWPAFGIFAATLAFLFVGLVWGHGNKDMR